MHLFAQHAALYERYRENDEKQYIRKHAGIPEAKSGKAFLIQVIHQSHRCIVRSAARNEKRGIENLKRTDCRNNGNVKMNRQQQRERHAPERAPAAGAVDFGRLVQVIRNRFEAGIIVDHRASRHLENAQARQHGQRLRRIREEQLRLDAEPAEHIVDHAVLGSLEHPCPDSRDNDEGSDDGQEVQALEKTRRAHARIDEQRQQQPDSHRRHDIVDREEHRIPDRLPGNLIREKITPVLKADEGRRADDRPVHERQHETEGQREQLEHKKMNQYRNQKYIHNGIPPEFLPEPLSRRPPDGRLPSRGSLLHCLHVISPSIPVNEAGRATQGSGPSGGRQAPVRALPPLSAKSQLFFMSS